MRIVIRLTQWTWVPERISDSTTRAGRASPGLMGKCFNTNIAEQQHALMIAHCLDPQETATSGELRRIAEGIYAGQAFDRLPLLADALLDAGCDDQELL